MSIKPLLLQIMSLIFPDNVAYVRSALSYQCGHTKGGPELGKEKEKERDIDIEREREREYECMRVGLYVLPVTIIITGNA